MSTLTQHPVEDRTGHLDDERRRLRVINRWLIAVIVVLALATAVLVLALTLGSDSTVPEADGPAAGTDEPVVTDDERSTLVDDLMTAFTEAEEATLVRLYAPDAVVHAADGAVYTGHDQITGFVRFWYGEGMRFTRVGDIVEHGAFVAVPVHFASPQVTGEMLTVIQLQGDLIVEEWHHSLS